MIMADAEGKKLTELRVIDLKTELERRGLDKTGNKAALLERLSKAISEEGEDPEEYLIVPCVGTNKISPRKNSVSGLIPAEEPHEIQDSNHKEDNTDNNKDNEEIKNNEQPKSPIAEVEAKPTLKCESPEIIELDPPEEEKKEEANEESQEEPKEKEKDNDKDKDKKEEVVVKEEPMEVDVEVKESAMEPEKIEEKKPSSENTSIAPPPAPVIDTNTVANTIETNGIDNEDSINLTIGEDEENLLAEEAETHIKQKDGGGKKRIEDNSKKGDSKGSRGDTGGGNKDSTSNSTGNKSKDDGGKSDSSNKGQKRDDKDKKTSSPANAGSRNLWVSGLSSTTRATDLKQIFSKYGKVIGAKVVTNARTPGARCYGYVTMSTSEDAAKCIQHLHRTELHGRVISVEKAKGDSQQSHMRKRESTNGKPEKKDDKDKTKSSDHHDSNDKKEKSDKKEDEDKPGDTPKKSEEKSHSDDKKSESSEKKDGKEEGKDADARSTKSTSKKPEGERKRDDKRSRPADAHRSHTRSRSRERRRRDDVLTFAKIREERERQRLRDRERLLREEERRRREDMERQREIERRQREEAARLEREREKLRRERERIEQEKAELLRLERERQKLEREKLERERLELKRQQMRLEESRRVPPPPAIKRSSSDRRDIREMYAEPERKRLTTDHSRRHSPERVSERRNDILERVSDRRIDGSPSGRYESSRSGQDLSLKKDFKRGSEFSSRSSRPETFTDVSRGREVIVRRETLPTGSSTIDPRQVKESRYERPSSTSYGRSEREVRRNDTDNHRSSRDSSRYSDSSKPPNSNTQGRDSRYSESSRTASGWHGSGPSSKSFNAVTSSGSQRSDVRNDQSSWSNRSSDGVNRWVSGSSGNTLRHPGPPMGYQGGPIQSMGITAPGTTPSNERFDPYKYSIPSMRKY
ncbi:SAFB-like transcription modulator isoform X2 [Fopius arisanus]|uniref:SAFB-like transcription modulator isoform X2 n=1 Tax=Fopius arisanus TaxID=64838 RepID=A0A9R1T570_9HYME|nr:PREDICTED: SAFB-like transcription modulator isoform X2 [Fopius arisanus]